MTILFHIHYQTQWGERLYVYGNLPALGDNQKAEAVPMNYAGDHNWTLQIETERVPKSLSYHYLVRDVSTILAEEAPGVHYHRLHPHASLISLYDQWRACNEELLFQSSAFTEVLFKERAKGKPQRLVCSQMLTLSLPAPSLLPSQQIALVGNNDLLGNWNPEQSLPLQFEAGSIWRITLDLSKLTFPLIYKYIIQDAQTKKLLAWESGENRLLNALPRIPESEQIIAEEPLRSPLASWRGAGTAIPLFSLRSENDFGIGEYPDIAELAAWAKETRQHLIQLLPVNDTTLTRTWQDSYPYNANSSFALHPIYLRLSDLGILSDAAKRLQFETLKEQLNKLPEVDYEAVSAAKWDYFRAIYEQEGEQTLSSHSFKAFFRQNEDWLLPYAAFSYLRDLYGTPYFEHWPQYSHYQAESIEELCAPSNPNYREIALYYYLQYHAFKQLSEAHKEAQKQGIILKGDIPIGISRRSVDAWANPHLFHLSVQAGAPPDDFSIKGQNWGFPTYNWKVMAREHFAWWRKRLQTMAYFFDAYRIDHILGFFRIWEIPKASVSGLMGYFNPALPLSQEEMRSYGFYFEADRHATPYIRRYFLYNLFGKYTDEVIFSYLTPCENELFTLQSAFDTQRKIADYFEGKADPKNEVIRKGLFALCEEVLFVEDPYKQGKFHPRIAAQQSYSYAALNDYEKECYNALYNDFFYHRHDDFWKGEALQKLPLLLESTDMLVCGEDLGMIPHCVPEVMAQLQILSLEIFRMPKEQNQIVANPASYPYRSVCSTSTHDMPPLRAWWEENRLQAQSVYNALLHHWGDAPFFCEPDICKAILQMNLQSPAMLAIFPWQDWLSISEKLRRNKPQEEQINDPSVSRHYWRYRMHISLEQLLQEKELNQSIRTLIENSGR